MPRARSTPADFWEHLRFVDHIDCVSQHNCQTCLIVSGDLYPCVEGAGATAHGVRAGAR